MKKFGYLLMMLMLLSGLSLSAQNYGKPYRPQHTQKQQNMYDYSQTPTVTMRSTSTFGSSGSALPQAAVTGTYTADQMNAPAHPGHLRRDMDGGFEDEEDPEIPEIPFPLGDAVLPLLLMALAFCGVVYFRRRRVLR